jgi:hypothetical protein
MMNEILTTPFNEIEVKRTLFQMFPLKALGPDGLHAFFFQKHWYICGTDVTRVVLRIVEGSEPAESINNTILVLISKVKYPAMLSQFCPIS